MRCPLAAPCMLRQWQQKRQVPVAQHFISLRCSFFSLQRISILGSAPRKKGVLGAGGFRKVPCGKSKRVPARMEIRIGCGPLLPFSPASLAGERHTEW